MTSTSEVEEKIPFATGGKINNPRKNMRNVSSFSPSLPVQNNGGSKFSGEKFSEVLASFTLFVGKHVDVRQLVWMADLFDDDSANNR